MDIPHVEAIGLWAEQQCDSFIALWRYSGRLDLLVANPTPEQQAQIDEENFWIKNSETMVRLMREAKDDINRCTREIV